MPNATVPAAATGLPEETAVLAETDRGLAVIRPASLKALRPSFLSEEETDHLLVLIDELASADQLWLSAPARNSDEALKAARVARRAMIPLLKTAQRSFENLRRRPVQGADRRHRRPQRVQP